MAFRDVLISLFVTHVPYWIAGAVLFIAIRKLRRSVEAIAARLEQRSERP